MLDKKLTLGGLQVGGPRTLQNSARFRVANNVYQTLDGQMIPRFGKKAYSTLPAGVSPVNSKIFHGLPFVICTDDVTGEYRTFYGNPLVETVNTINPDGLFYPDSALGVQFTEKNNTLYFNIPIIGIFKFDGIHVQRAGVPTSYGSPGSPGEPSGGTLSNFFVRFMQLNVDYQGNVVYSGYTQGEFDHQNSFDIEGVDDIIFGPGAVIFGVWNTLPDKRYSWDKTNAGFIDFYYHLAGGTSPTLVSGEWEVDLDPGNYNLKEGCWVQWIGTLPGALAASLQAIKIDRLDGDTAYCTKMKLFDGETWASEQDIIDVNFVPDFATSQWITVWSSDQATGNYVFKNYLGKYETKTVDFSSPTVPSFIDDGVEDAFNIAGNMGDIIDVTTEKRPFPGVDSEYSHAMTVYGELLCASGTNVVYFNDTSLGGSFEMVNGLSFITAGDSSDGPIQSICGTSRFLLVSRQFKNFYISGNLPTANYAVNPAAATSLGAYSNETSIAINDSVFFLNKTGLWVMYSGGKCEQVSQNIPGLFSTFSDTTSYVEEAKWSIDEFDTHAGLWATGESDKWIKLRYDNCRNMLLILIRGGDDRGNALALNISNGEFYTWDKLASDGEVFNDLDFMEGFYYMTDGAVISKEEKEDASFKYAYGDAELITTWLTAGEPSFEKKVNQLKIFGRILGDLTISHYVDWKDSAAGSAEYSNSDADTFSHKKRIESINALAASIGVVFSGTKFEIEGMEIEFSPLQQGMKR